MKSFVNADDGSDLSDFSPALTCIRSLNESEFLLDDERSKYVKSLSLRKLKDEEKIAKKDGFWFAVSLRDGACLYTSKSIADHLGYPEDMLLGQSFLNFLYQKDHLTFANHLTQGLNVCFSQEMRDNYHLVQNIFFCRIRVYQGLKYGYSVADKKPMYKPFKIILHINELVLDDVCVEKPSATLCVKATAAQVSSAYSVPKEIPAMTSFSTRHTASCHFSHVDTSAIPYLGYLPQDMVGYSVFDFYHIDDMPQLKEIYELVVKEHGSSFRSKPYRFKVHNGCFIMLETEWSCFINPWSHKLEFVVGQHRVLKGPSDIDIFRPCEVSEMIASDEIMKESLNIQNEIKVILSKSLNDVKFRKSKRLCSKRKRELASFVYSCFDKNYKENNDETAEKLDAMDEVRSHSDLDSAAMGDISPFRETNDSISSPPTVQQMRYQENIERFFASQPKTYSDGSDDFSKNEKSPTVEEYQSSNTGSGTGSGTGNVSGNSSKEQSVSPNYEIKNRENGSNSSKYNMSSFTTGDSGYGKSWVKEGTNDLDSSEAGPSKEIRMKNTSDNIDNSITFTSCLALTEETLTAHNKINHKQIKQRKNASSYTKASASFKDNSHTQQNEISHSKKKKTSRKHNSQSALPKSSLLSSSGYKCTAPKKNQSNRDNCSTRVTNPVHNCPHSQHTLPKPANLPAPFFIPVIYMGGVPYFPPHTTMNPFWTLALTSNAENVVNDIPSTPECDFNLNPLIPGFPYPSFPAFSGTPNCNNCNHTVSSSGVTTTSLLSTTTTTVASEASAIYKDTNAGKTRTTFSKEFTEKMKIKDGMAQESESNESDMQIDESLSSFTKSCSQQSQDKDEDMDMDLKKFYPSSKADKVELSSDIAYRYQMNVSDMDEILKKDREILKSMHQPDLVNKQLQMLQEEIKDENESKPKPEDDFCITEEMMLGLTPEEAVNEELENREARLMKLMCEES